MAEIDLRKLSTELEMLMMRVTALERALDAAGIAIPKTRQQLANEAAAEQARLTRGR